MQFVSGMYELFILGKLMHRPMHGYLLQSIINAAIGPYRRLSWGTLYPLLRKLEHGGFIAAAQASQTNDGRHTKTYRATPRGRDRFVELVRSSSQGDSEYRDWFRIRLSNFGHLRRKDRLAILWQYRGFLSNLMSHSEAMAKNVLKAQGLALDERPYVLKAIDHQRHLAASEMAWVDELIRATGGDDDHEAQRGRIGSKPDGNRRHSTSARARNDGRQ